MVALTGLLPVLVLVLVTAGAYATRHTSEDVHTTSDMELIEYEIKQLNRPNVPLDNTVLVQEVEKNRELTKYRWVAMRPGDRNVSLRRYHTSRIVLRRPGMEVGANNIIFNSGKHDGFGPKSNRTYVVLRKYEKVKHPHTYLVNLVYIWTIGTRQEIHIEWQSFDEVDYLALNTHNRIERALCREDDCDFPQFIYGTCDLVSMRCSEVLAEVLTTSRDGYSDEDSDEESDEDDSYQDESDEDRFGSRNWRGLNRSGSGRSWKSWRRSGDRGRSSDEKSDEKSDENENKNGKSGVRVRVRGRPKKLRKDDNSDEKKDRRRYDDYRREKRRDRNQRMRSRSLAHQSRRLARKLDVDRHSKESEEDSSRERWRWRESSDEEDDHDRDTGSWRTSSSRGRPKLPSNFYKALEQNLVNGYNDGKDFPGGVRLEMPEPDVPMHWEPDGHVLREIRRRRDADQPPKNYYQMLTQLRDQEREERGVKDQGNGKMTAPAPAPASASASASGPMAAMAAVSPEGRRSMMKAMADAKNANIRNMFDIGGGVGGNSTKMASITNSTNPTPTSFDLLLLDRKQLPNGNTELGFQSEVVDRPREPVADAELSQICYDCQSIGTFYEDYMEEAKVSRKIGRILRKMHRRQRRKRRNRHRVASIPTNQSTPVAAFVGFGDCGDRELFAIRKSPRHPKSRQLDDVIEFYVETLRVQCEPELVDELRSWLTTKLKFLRVEPDLSLGLMPSSLLMRYNLLSKEEYEILFSAAILAQYTLRFVEETNLGMLVKHNVAAGKGHIQLSPETAFLRRMSLRLLTYIQYQIPQHYVKLTRSLLQLLQDKFFTLLIERIRLLKVGRRITRSQRSGPAFLRIRDEARVNIALNYNDLQQIMGIKEYVMFGIEPSLKSGVPNREAFESFYSLNEQRIKYLVDSYKIKY